MTQCEWSKLPEQIRQADCLYVSHSGGKDSQAMLAYLHGLAIEGIIPSNIVLVHSDLGDMEHEPMHQWIEANSLGYPLHVVNPGISFWDLCRKWKRLPDGKARFCTMYLKTEPISEFIHKHMTQNGYTRAINAVGIRAEESPSRAAKPPFKISDMTKPRKHPGHTVWDWYPIFDFNLCDVRCEIDHAGQSMHRIYSEGYSRLSCTFCVFAKKHELQQSAKRYPAEFQKMAELELELGRTIRLKQRNKQKVNQFITEYC